MMMINCPDPAIAELLKAGTVIALEDFNQFAVVEDNIAGLVDPSFNRELWAARSLIKDSLRPKIDGKPFNGGFRDIRLEIMADPYDRLMDYSQRGLRVQQESGNFVRAQRSEQTISQYVGFSILANLTSSGRGIFGSTSAELWIAPLANTRSKSGTERKTTYKSASGELKTYTFQTKKNYTHPSVVGKALERFVTHPEFNKSIEPLDEQAKANGQKIYLALLAMTTGTDTTR